MQGNPTLKKQIQIIESAKFTVDALVAFFGALEKDGFTAVLLVDDFDALVGDEQNRYHFFQVANSLRASTAAPTVIFVCASRLSTKELKEVGGQTQKGIQNFLDHTVHILLPPFNPNEVQALLDSTLLGTRIQLSIQDRAYITRIADSHPYLVQAAAATLLETRIGETALDQVYTRAERTFGQRTSAQIQAIWDSLSEKSKFLLLMLSLAEVNGQAFGRRYDLGDLRNLENYESELEQLFDRGLVDQIGHLAYRSSVPSIKKCEWCVVCDNISSWVINNAVGASSESPKIAEWLQNKEIIGAMPRENIAVLVRVGNWLWQQAGRAIELLRQISALGSQGKP